MDPGEHDIVHDINSSGNQSIFSLGNTSAINNNIMSSTGGGLDLLDLLGGGSSETSTIPPSTETQQTGTALNSTSALPSSLSSSFPNLSNMPLFATVPPSAVNGTVSTSTQYEFIPGQFFPSSFFTLGRSEQLASLAQKVEQDSIMAGNENKICKMIFFFNC